MSIKEIVDRLLEKLTPAEIRELLSVDDNHHFDLIGKDILAELAMRKL